MTKKTPKHTTPKDLISPFFRKRLNTYIRKDIETHGLPDQKPDGSKGAFCEKVKRHLAQYHRGNTLEDDLAAIAYCCMRIICTQDAVAPKPAPDNYADIIKEGRIRNHWSKRQLATFMGVTDMTIGNWERSKHSPRPLEWRHLKDLLS